METRKIGHHEVGPGNPVFIIGEIGINHNGDLDIAKKLIDSAINAGCQAVKFQKRTVEVVYSESELETPRKNPFGPTNGDLKRGLEFGKDEYTEIDQYCKKNGMLWFSSCWDKESVDFIGQFQPPCFKIASASLTDDNLLAHHKQYDCPMILSTGMSTIEQIDRAIQILGKENLIVLQCTSTYPSKLEELNLKAIHSLGKRYGVPIGYSGHEVGLIPTVVAAALGACMVERHITLDRSMWGSDQASSVEIPGLTRLVKDIRAMEKSMGDGEKTVYESEKPIMDKLRRIGN
jgi:N-acetylneuraminate synthase